jgi:membrane fusion protein, multidrug efflux system
MQNRYKTTLFTTVLCAVGVMMSGCGKPAAQAKAPMGPPEVGIVVMKQEPVALTTELSGRTAASLVAEVRPQVGGIIQKRLFTEGSDVKAGEVLYQIDPASYQAAYASAKAALSKAEASLTPVRLKAERFKQLVGINAVSKQDFDEASAAVKSAEAEVEAARANVETARINLAYTRVTAPIAGRIGRSSVTTGSLVTASQAAPLSTIQSLGSVYVDVTQSTADLLRLKQALASGRVKSGGAAQTKVKLLLEDGSAYPLEGALKFSDVTVDQSTGSVTVRSVFPNPKQALLPGMYVRAVIEEGVVADAILVPQRAVSRDQAGNATAMVVGEKDTVEPRILKVSRALGDKWLVESGLKPQDRVIVEGLQRARPGTQVKVVPFAAKPAAGQAGSASGQPASAQPAAQPASASAQPASAKAAVEKK